MNVQASLIPNEVVQKQSPQPIVLLTAKEAAKLLKVSVSWLAKARMRGDGPPFIRFHRSIRYIEQELIQWMNAHRRLSTSER